MNAQLVRRVLIMLAAADDMPMPEPALVVAVQEASKPVRPTMGDVQGAIADAEAREWVIGLTPELGDRIWGLTDKGKLRAAQIR